MDEIGAGVELVQTVLKITFEGSTFMLKIAGKVGKHTMAMLLAALQKPKTKGQIRLKQMLTSGKELSIFSVKPEDMKRFAEQAKKYGITYNVIKSNAVCDIMAPAEQAVQVKRVLEKLEIATVQNDVDLPEIKTTQAQTEQTEKEQEFLDNAVGVDPERAKQSQEKTIDELVEDELKTGNPKQALEKDPLSKPLSERKNTGKAEKPSVKKKINALKNAQKTPGIKQPIQNQTKKKGK